MSGTPEPALKAGALVSGIAALIVFYGLMSAEEVALWVTVVGTAAAAGAPLLQAWWTRSKVMPVETIKEAGLTPAGIQTRADDPKIEPAK